MPVKTSDEKLKFIFDNRDKMRPSHIAKHLNMAASSVHYILKGERRYQCKPDNEFFDVDTFGRLYSY